jgi:hypothetical protein
MMPPLRRDLKVTLGQETRSVVFEGRPLKVAF